MQWLRTIIPALGWQMQVDHKFKVRFKLNHAANKSSRLNIAAKQEDTGVIESDFHHPSPNSGRGALGFGTARYTVEQTSSLFGLLRPAECDHMKITGVRLKKGEVSLGRENRQQLCSARKMGLQQRQFSSSWKGDVWVPGKREHRVSTEEGGR